MSVINGSTVNSTSVAEPNMTVQSLLLVVNLAVMIFICGGNLLTILAVFRTAALRTVPNMYVVSLAVADFCTGAIIPYYALSLFPGFNDILKKDKYLCLFRYVLFHIFVTESIVCLVAIAYDRYLFIRYPLHYPTMTSKKKARLVIMGTWIASICVGVLHLYGNTWTPGTKCESFKILSEVYRIYIVVPAFFACCLLGACLYGYIIWKARRHQRQARERRASQGSLSKTSARKDWKTVKVFVLVYGVFVACWFPNFIVLITVYVRDINKDVLKFTVVLGFLNSGMNFIIYAWENKHFRGAFKVILCGGRNRCYPRTKASCT